MIGRVLYDVVIALVVLWAITLLAALLWIAACELRIRKAQRLSQPWQSGGDR